MLRIRRSVREAAVRSFLHEARLIARMEHPNVVRVYDFGYWRDTPFLVMEHAAARNLRDVVDDVPGLPVDRVLAIMRDVLAGLGYLHTHRILHRDLKPANVLLGRDGRWKLGDFGIAIHQGEFAGGDRLAPPRASLGTPAFMSPEAARGDVLGPASDVYSAGAMLYLLLTGRPYVRLEGLAIGEMRRVIQHAQGAPLDLPDHPWLAPLMVRMMDKDAGRRPQDGNAALSELERGLSQRQTV
jgi:serine/threonine protein kinase